MRVIVLHADGLPIWALGAYGNDWIQTPHLDEFAGGAVVFDQHHADVPRRLEPSNLSAGYDAVVPTRPGVAKRRGGDFPLATALALPRPAASVLCWIECPALLPPWDVAADEDSDAIAPWPDPVPGWIDANDDDQLERLRQTFATVVEAFDQWFGEWQAPLREAGVLDDSLIALISGRGQNLGEHGLLGEFRPWLHEELVHLPLIIRLPGAAQGGRRVPHLTQTFDLAPTFAAALGLSSPAEGPGRDLLPLCRGGPPVRDYAVTAARQDGAAEYALQTREEKIIVPVLVPPGDPPRGPMYFVKPDDRWEVTDLRLANLDRAEALEQNLREFMAAAGRPGPLTLPPLPQSEMHDGNSETGGREHDQSAGSGGLRGHPGDPKGRAHQ